MNHTTRFTEFQQRRDDARTAIEWARGRSGWVGRSGDGRRFYIRASEDGYDYGLALTIPIGRLVRWGTASTVPAAKMAAGRKAIE